MVVVTLSLGVILWICIGAFFKGALDGMFSAVVSVISILAVIVGAVYALNYLGFGWGLYLLWLAFAAVVSYCLSWIRGFKFSKWAIVTAMIHGFACVVHSLAIISGFLSNAETSGTALLFSLASAVFFLYCALTKNGQNFVRECEGTTESEPEPEPEPPKPITEEITEEEREDRLLRIESLRYPLYYREKFIANKKAERARARARAEYDAALIKAWKESLAAAEAANEAEAAVEAEAATNDTGQSNDIQIITSDTKEADMPTRKQWYLIDDTTLTDRSLHYDELFVEEQEDAIAKAQKVWDAMSQDERDRRTKFYVCFARTNSIGVPDLNSATKEYFFKDTEV